MILRRVICEAVASYFDSADWNDLIKQLARGEEVLHAHIYAESILHPGSLIPIVQGYFEARRLPLLRRIFVVGNGRGMTAIYNIHPRQDMAHFDIIHRYSPDHILAPMEAALTREGKTVSVWDEQYMKKHYARFDFRTKLTEEDEQDLKSYFDSSGWKEQYVLMTTMEDRHDYSDHHVHSMVETSIHPEIILEFGKKALTAKGWELSKAVNVVWGMKNFDQGKCTFLLKKPEMVLELEW